MCHSCASTLDFRCALPAELSGEEVTDTGQISAEDASRGFALAFVISIFHMEETKESLAFKGVAERLTLGITRILGVYHVYSPPS